MTYKVNCAGLDKYTVARLVTELVNAPVNVDDYDVVIYDEDWDFDKDGNVFYDIETFEIIDENKKYDYYDMKNIEECLQKYNVYYELWD